MPMYQCFVPAGTLNRDEEAKIARVLTDVHTALTGAPPSFVHVVFRDGFPVLVDNTARHPRQPSGRPRPSAHRSARR